MSREGKHLAISAEARDFILRTRPELAGAFQVDGRSLLVSSSGFRLSSFHISIDTLLTPATNPPSGPFPPTLVGRMSPRAAPPVFPNSKPTTRLGDAVAALLHRLRVDALVALLQRRGLLLDCGCAARHARLNALGPRLRAQVEPLPLTLAMLLAWLLLAVVLLVR